MQLLGVEDDPSPNKGHVALTVNEAQFISFCDSWHWGRMLGPTSLYVLNAVVFKQIPQLQEKKEVLHPLGGLDF